MGADLLMSWVWTTQPEKIDFEKAREIIRAELTDDIDEVPDDKFWARWDLNGEFDVYDDGTERSIGTQMRERLLLDTDEVEQIWTGDGFRDVAVAALGPVTAILSGGMSWGDSPTEAFDLLNRWGNTPAAKAAGFFDWEEPTDG